MSTRSILIVILTVTFLALLVMAVVAVNDAVNKDGGWEAVWRAMSVDGFWDVNPDEILVYGLLFLFLTCFGTVPFLAVVVLNVRALTTKRNDNSSGSWENESWEEEEEPGWNPFQAASEYFDGFFGISRKDD